MIISVETSAALKLVARESESEEVAAHLERSHQDGHRLVSSMLLFTELPCAAGRRQGAVEAAVNAVLDNFWLTELINDDLLRAGQSSWGLRIADAIHLAVALRLRAGALVAYDRELLTAAESVGLRTLSPGRT